MLNILLKSNQIPPVRGVLSPKIRVPLRGYCFKFHRGVDCDAGCAFKHLLSVRVHIWLVAVIFVAKVEPLQTDPCLPSPNLKMITC